MPEAQGLAQSTWGWPVIVYLFLAGVGAGACLFAWWAERRQGPESLVTAGRRLAAPLVAAGTLLLVFDLGAGRMHPLRILGLYSHPASVMTLGTWILSIFLVLSVVDGYGPLAGLRPPRWWAGLTALFALGVALYTGVLLGVVQAIPFWNNALLPVLFVLSAASAGMSAASLTALLVERGRVELEGFRDLHRALLVAEAAVLALYLYFAAHGPEAARLSYRLVVAGPLAPAFWLGLVGAGLALPALFELLAAPRLWARVLTRPAWLGLEAGLVLVGGLCLRLLVVGAGVPMRLL
ncbi:MAG: polysulfide reductase NrfD [Clostridia bacterium]|nr:polysulfide reductase NrfD [Clostridia bacterium]